MIDEGVSMEVTYSDIFKIHDKAIDKFLQQQTAIFWDTDKGEAELSYDDKRVIALIEAISEVLDIDIKIDYRTRVKKYV